MSNESSLSAAADFEYARNLASIPGVRLRAEERGNASATRRVKTHRPGAEHRSIRGPRDGALPPNDFLKDLHREKRRAERSQVALSLVLYLVNEDQLSGVQRVDELLEVLHRAKRETDILGHVGTDTIAVLCPDTDESGTQAFIRKIDAMSDDGPFPTVAATYPNDLFENLAAGTRTQPAFHPFVVSDSTDPQQRGYRLKRYLDIVGAIVAITLLAPFMLVIALLIGMTSKGPVIFRQTRVGKGGVPFTFYKFRSMLTNVDDSIHRNFVADLIKGERAENSLAADKPSTYKLQSDPRVTPIGRFIRRTSIDELPQFFNVLKGDMSLVGPRPPIPYEAAQYQPWHLRRLMTLKPGITGIWQVEGRSRVPFNEMVRMDLRYIRECSLALDLKILLATIVVVFRGDGAD